MVKSSESQCKLACKRIFDLLTPTSFDSERTKGDSLIYTLYFRNCRFSFQYRLHPILQICIAYYQTSRFIQPKARIPGLILIP